MQKIVCLLFFIPSFLLSQISLSGKVIDEETRTALPFVTIQTDCTSSTLTSIAGDFKISCDDFPIQLTVKYAGYKTKNFSVTSKEVVKIVVRLTPKSEELKQSKVIASELIKNAIKNKELNDPNKVLSGYTYKSYNKFKITKDSLLTLTARDTNLVGMERIINNSHSFLSEKTSIYQNKKRYEEKETILATRMTGFEKPIYNTLGIELQSNSLYQDDYVVFNTKYASPLSNKALKNYEYKIIDTTQSERPAYVVVFQPKRSKKVASLEGLLYIDKETLAAQKMIAELRGELNVMVTHNLQYNTEEKLWFLSDQEVIIRPGFGKEKITLFGGKISVGSLDTKNKKQNSNNNFLVSKTDFFDLNTNTDPLINWQQAAIEIDPQSTNRDEQYWNQYRTSSITEKDLNSFPIVDSIVKAQNIERRISVIQSFNTGYYPVGFFDFDLTYPIKYNNYEGVRLGLGGVTNQKFSNTFRLEGYLVYGFIDRRFKYGVGGGVSLNKKTGSWLNVNYTDDLKEIGSFFYLTDRRVYSLFEPRLVNIDSYYRHKTWTTSLQHRILPRLLSETQVSISDIDQTQQYSYLYDGELLSSYKMAEATIALRWSPFSKFLSTPNGFKEIRDGYPKITAQYTQGLKDVFDSDFNYNKIGIKAEYTINRLNQSSTSFLLEGDLANGDIPLTHLLHAYPNSPTKETVLQRFSVAGRRSFETMFFSEFFSDKLATLQVRHRLRPFKIANWLKPELVLITRHAIGDISNISNHQGISFKSLQQGYQESGLEINKIFAGFGLSFAYRYGAYHLPVFEDNIAFKFTFYLKL
ncbi:DUF5686 family protein [Aquimarina addita]|uniref:DUF5686 family protein n=1 Tax=Aquimarina addita TaxID=870485 RepID=A0ABP6UIE6_9FLAO